MKFEIPTIKIKFIALLLLLGAVFVAPFLAYAQTDPCLINGSPTPQACCQSYPQSPTCLAWQQGQSNGSQTQTEYGCPVSTGATGANGVIMSCDSNSQCNDIPSCEGACVPVAQSQCNKPTSAFSLTPPNITASSPNPQLPVGIPSGVPNSAPSYQPACNGDPNLTLVNGVCLPASGVLNVPNTGIAGSTTLSGLIILIIKLLLGFAGMIAIVVLIIGGYWYITAAGNEEMSEKGRKAITNAIIGLVIIILSYAIVTIISSTLVANTFP